jgi:hypothetical protein
MEEPDGDAGFRSTDVTVTRRSPQFAGDNDCVMVQGERRRARRSCSAYRSGPPSCIARLFTYAVHK